MIFNGRVGFNGRFVKFDMEYRVFYICNIWCLILSLIFLDFFVNNFCLGLFIENINVFLYNINFYFVNFMNIYKLLIDWV